MQGTEGNGLSVELGASDVLVVEATGAVAGGSWAVLDVCAAIVDVVVIASVLEVVDPVVVVSRVVGTSTVVLVDSSALQMLSQMSGFSHAWLI